MIWYAYHDAGGAKAILAKAAGTMNMGKKIFAAKEYSFQKEFDIPVEVVADLNASHFNGWNLQWPPSEIYTSTSVPAGFELAFLKFGKFWGIKTRSFIDSWVNMKLRFTSPDEEGGYCWPDEIHVTDDQALTLAISEGIPKELLKVTGNPYLNYLESWKPTLSRSEFEQAHQLDSSKLHLVFAPDPLSNIGGKAKFGTDEIEISKVFLEGYCANNMDSGFNLLLKLHPKQAMAPIKELLGEFDVSWTLWEKPDLNSLLFYSHAIVGMSSNILVEARSLGCRTYRFGGENLNQEDVLKWAGFSPPQENIKVILDDIKLIKHSA